MRRAYPTSKPRRAPRAPAPEPLEHIVNRLKREGVIAPYARGSNTPRALKPRRRRAKAA